MKNECDYLLGVLILLSVVFASCQYDKDVEDLSSEEQVSTDHDELESVPIVPYVMEDEDGTSVSGVLEGDVFYSYDQLADVGIEIDARGNIRKKSTSERLRMTRSRIDMCRAPYFVNSKRKITIHLDKVHTKARNAVRSAVSELNKLNMGLAFVPVENEVGDKCSRITLYTKGLEGNTIGRATFPRGGNPGPTIQLDGDFLNRASSNEIKNLFIHELGHCLGFRHSDWNGRVSCGGEPRVENVSNTFFVGGPDNTNGKKTNSIMRSCGPDNLNMTSDDKTAFYIAYKVEDARKCTSRKRCN